MWTESSLAVACWAGASRPDEGGQADGPGSEHAEHFATIHDASP